MANVLDWLGLRGGIRRRGGRFTDPMASPWQQGNLTEIVYSDIFPNADFLPIGRADAMTIPSVSKGRNLLVSAVAKFPLVALDKDGILPDAKQPSFLYRTNGNVTPYERLVWTIDDAIFYGASVWDTTRGVADKNGRRDILDATWRPPSMWRINANGELELMADDGITWYIADSDDCILFNFPFEGLLTIAQRTMKGALAQERAWVGRASNPVPIIELHVTDDSNLTPDEVKAFVQAWATARASDLGAIGFTPQGLEIRTHGEVKADMMTEGRNAIRTDLGSFLNIPTVLMDGSLSEASLTYSTTEGNRNRFYEESLPFWMDPITARLSQDDVVPRGQRVRFDLSEALGVPTPTGAPVAD